MMGERDVAGVIVAGGLIMLTGRRGSIRWPRS